MTPIPSPLSIALRRHRWRQTVLLPALALLVVGVSSCSASNGIGTSASPSASSTPAQSPSASGSPASGKFPDAIVVLGHSGTTGYNSDPSSPGADAEANSWATGDNPTVQSIYSRLLAVNPAVAGHNTNLGVDGSDIGDLSAQVDQALTLNPMPDLFMIQEVDNDLKCDGTDKDNYGRFAETLRAQLTRIATASPRATILLVSSPPGTVQNYGEVVAALPEAKSKNTGTGPCDMFDPSGKAVPAHWRYQDSVIKGYQSQLASVCKQFANCVYDDGALYRLKITAGDLAPDGEHLSIAGHAKQAALEWKVLGLGS